MPRLSQKTPKKDAIQPRAKYNIDDENELAAAVDEAGRGPLLSRVYGAAVVLGPNFVKPPHIVIKDSKKMTKKQLEDSAKWIKENVLDWAVAWRDEEDITETDSMSESVYQTWHDSLDDLTVKFNLIIVDGKCFKPYKKIKHICEPKADSTFLGVSCASILAKTERDNYIQELVEEYPALQTRYNIANNVGYGTEAHMKGIEKYGICQFHRKTFSPCNEPDMRYNPITQHSE